VLPSAYQPVAAALLIAGGALACFTGYRLFRIVLGIYGFLLGALIASSMVGGTNTAGMLIAALLGGAIGAAVLVLGYFVGVALVGAGVGVLLVHLAWTGFVHTDPPALAVIGFSILGGIGAMLLQRYVIIASTAFGGAWTIVIGLLALMSARARDPHAPWILYPMSTDPPGSRWVWVVWIVLGLIGTGVQLRVTGKKSRG
jgi:hypothetical protein